MCDFVYEIENCNDSNETYTVMAGFTGDPFNPYPDIKEGELWTFTGNVNTDGKCFIILTVGSTCIGRNYPFIEEPPPEYQNLIAGECSSSYRLTNCGDNADTILINWEGVAALDFDTTYTFDFDTNKCWTVESAPRQCGIPVYNDSNLISSFADCDTCNAVCYRLIDCNGGADILTSDDLAGYVGQTIKWTDNLDVERCSSVTSFICREESFVSTDVTVVSCYDTCTECTFVPEEQVEPEFQPTKRIVQPKYELTICRPEDYEKANCRFSELMFHDAASKRYGIEFCCDDDLSKWEVKAELINLQLIQSRFNEEDFPAGNGLEQCDGVGIGTMRINDDSCVIFRVTPIDEPLIP